MTSPQFREVMKRLKSGSAVSTYASAEAMLDVLGEHQESTLRAAINTEADKFALAGSSVIRTGECAVCGGGQRAGYDLLAEVRDTLNGSRYKVRQHEHRDPNARCTTCNQDWPCRTAQIIAAAIL